MSTPRTLATSTILTSLVAGVALVTAQVPGPSSPPGSIADVVVNQAAAYEWEDGLDRYMVTVDAAVLQQAESDTPDLALDLEDVDTGDVLSSGDIEEFDPRLAEALSHRGPVTAAGSIDASESVVAYLESLPGVASARYLADGTAEITTMLDAGAVAELPGLTDTIASLPLVAFDWEPTDPWFQGAWQLDSRGQTYDGRTYQRDADIDAPEAWGIARGDGVVIAVIDGGFTDDAPELAPNLWQNPGEICGNGLDDDGNGYADDCHGWDFNNRMRLRPWDGSAGHLQLGNHGVAVASAAAAPAGNGGVVGVAPDARLMLLGAGNGSGINSAAVFEAVEYAIANGADVVNFSFGAVLTSNVNVDAYRNYYRPLLDKLEAADIVVTAAAGNSGDTQGSTPVAPALFVGERPNGVAVAATDSLDQLAYYSQYGGWVTLSAPGTQIPLATPDGQFRYMSGTSFSSPVTAGAAAVLRSANPAATAPEVVAALVGGADRLPQLAWKVPEGRRLNAARALSVLGGADLVDVVFTNLVDMGPTARVSISAPAGDAVAFTLAVMVDGQVLAVPGRSITWNGTTVESDAQGRAVFGAGLSSGVDAEFHVADLPSGSYGLIVEATDGGRPVDVPVLSVFTVGVGPVPVTTTLPRPPTSSRSDATTTTLGAGQPAGGGNTGGGGGAVIPVTTTTTSLSGAGSGSGGGSAPGPTWTSPTTTVPGSGWPAGGGSGGGWTPVTTIVRPGGSGSPATSQPPVPATTSTTVATIPSGTQPNPGSSSTGSPTGINISSVSPSSISTAGDVVVVYGSHFPAYPVVTIGGRQAQLIAVLGDRTLLVQAPPAPAGWVDVTVSPISDPADVAIRTNALRYVGPSGSGSASGSGSTGGGGGGGGTGSTGGSTGGSPPSAGSGGSGGSTATTTVIGGPGATTGTTVRPTASTTLRTIPPTPPNPPNTAAPGTQTPRIPIDSSDSMSWNVVPPVGTGAIGAVGSTISVGRWNDAYQASGSSTGVRLG